MRLQLIVTVTALAGISCATRTVTRVPAAPAHPQQTTFERQIQNAHDAGDGDYRLRVLRERVATAPGDIPARLELAAAYRERGYPDVALEICRLAAARFPQSADVQVALVRSLRDMNQRNEAIAELDGFLQSHPQTSAEAYSWLGILRDESGQWIAAEGAHRKAAELAPAQEYVHNNLGYNLLMQKKPAEAAAEFRQALRLNPASALARNNLGMAMAAQDDKSEALSNWQSAADPATAHNNLAAILIEKGNYAEARKELELALGYNKAHPAALRNMELVSRLDGNAATVPAKQNETRWDRWKAGLVRLFVGPLEEPRTESASRGQSPLEVKEER